MIYAGGGILKAGASEALRELAELTGIPVVTTLMARGSFPDSHPLCLGMPGMHGNYTAVTAMQQADLLIALGSRFDDRVTGKVCDLRAEGEGDPRRHRPGRDRQGPPARSRIVADCRLAIEALIASVMRAAGPLDPGRLDPWIATLRQWQARVPLHLRPLGAGPRRSRATRHGQAADAQAPVRHRVPAGIDTPDDTILVSGVGQHQMWASQYWAFEHPNTWINSGGLGTMGFAVPAAIGAKVGRPDRMVWAIDGDGCFQMTAQELVTASAERIPVKIAILNNAYLGMVRQWQHMFYEERYSEVYLSPDLPDYVGWAESMGCVGLRVESA